MAGPRHVGVLAAMPIELKGFARRASLRRQPWGPRTSTWHGHIGRTTVTAGITGIGPARATEVTERFLASFPLDQVVMMGVAGGLDPALRIGDLVVPEVVLDAASGRRYRPDAVPGFPCSGVLRTSATIVTDDEDLDRLRSEGVVALDMESAAVGAVCEGLGRPWCVFRGISDRVADGIVGESTLAMTRPDGSADLGAVVRQLIAHPGLARHLVKLGRDTARATAAIARATRTECERV